MLRRTIALFFAIALPTIALAQGDANEKKRLKEAETLLDGTGEASIRNGAMLCLEVNSANAMEKLLDVLNGENPHRRDIVWEAIPKFTDPYARRRVELELKTNTKNDPVRQWCCEAIGIFGEKDFAATVERCLTDDDEGVRAAAAAALGKLALSRSFDKVSKLGNDKDPFVRAAAIEAAARCQPEKAHEMLLHGLADPDGGVRCALLGVLPLLDSSNCETLSAYALTDTDWRPRFQAVENLAAIKTKSAVDSLILATGDGRPRVARRAHEALRTLSGLQYDVKQQWDDWWKANRETFDFAAGVVVKEGAKGNSQVTYNGIEVTSDHVAFVIDTSGDMSRDAKNGTKKDDLARKELTATLEKLIGTGFTFNLHTYGQKFQSFEKAPVLLDKKSMKRALDFAQAQSLAGNKAIWDVLVRVISDPTIDTIYLLSSGEPEVGLYVHWNRVTEHLVELNRHHKVVIHTIAYTDSKWYQEQLVEIAKSTGGTFIVHE